MKGNFSLSVVRQSRASFIRGLLIGLHYIPQISHPKTGTPVRSRYEHTQNICQLARLLHLHFNRADSPLWPQLCLRLACHDIGHTPYGHAGERVVQRLYDPEFSNSSQSKRYMFAGTEDWPEGVIPFAWYRSAPIRKLNSSQEQDLAALVDFFDNLENAVGDALDLKTLGHPLASEFLLEACNWSGTVRYHPGKPLAQYMKQVIIQAFEPSSFGSLAKLTAGGAPDCAASLSALRTLIAEERGKCPGISEIDNRANCRIPVLFDQAQEFLQGILPTGHCRSSLRRVAVDMIASTNELELA